MQNHVRVRRTTGKHKIIWDIHICYMYIINVYKAEGKHKNSCGGGGGSCGNISKYRSIPKYTVRSINLAASKYLSG